MTERSKVALAGSQKTPMPGATQVGPTDPNQIVEVSVVLKQRRPLDSDHLQGKILSHEEYAAAYGADPESILRVKALAHANHLRVIDRDDEVARHTVTLQGTVANLEKAFSVSLNDYEHPGGRYRGRTGAVHIPADLQDIVEGVFGLDNRPQAAPGFRAGARASDTEAS